MLEIDKKAAVVFAVFVNPVVFLFDLFLIQKFQHALF